MPSRGYLQDPIQAERATGDILDKPLKRIAVRGGNEHTLVNAEPGMLPRAHLFDSLMGNQPLVQEQFEHLVLPQLQKRLNRESRQGNEKILVEFHSDDGEIEIYSTEITEDNPGNIKPLRIGLKFKKPVEKAKIKVKYSPL
jgi:hypothetical protein